MDPVSAALPQNLRRIFVATLVCVCLLIHKYNLTMIKHNISVSSLSFVHMSEAFSFLIDSDMTPSRTGCLCVSTGGYCLIQNASTMLGISPPTLMPRPLESHGDDVSTLIVSRWPQLVGKLCVDIPWDSKWAQFLPTTNLTMRRRLGFSDWSQRKT